MLAAIIWLALAAFTHITEAIPLETVSTAEIAPLVRRGETIVYKDYTLTYFDDPSSSAEDTTVNGVVALAATTAATMKLTVCTGTPVYNGDCIKLTLQGAGCIDFPAGSKWDNSISSIEVETMNSLCRIWRGHACSGDGAQTTYLNEGDTSRDKIKMSDWNDDISSVACYPDIRGVTGDWNS